MANFLVTGGCGFIGSHLVDSLIDDGHQVRVLDDLSAGKLDNVPTQCEVVEGDITDNQLVQKCLLGMDGCFHLAAIASVLESNDNWLKAHEVNLTGAVNVFDACRRNRTPVVYASSKAVYGDNADMPLTESSGTRPITAFGADKLATESHARVASVVHGVPTLGMRLFNVYGPRQNPDLADSGIVSIIVDRILRQQALCIYGDGDQVRDFIFVGDVVRLLRAAMTNISLTTTVFNVCSGESVTINQLASMVMSITGLSVQVKHLPSRKGDMRVSVGDPAQANKMLSMTAGQSLVRGIRELIESSKPAGITHLKAINRMANQIRLGKSDQRTSNKVIGMPLTDSDGVIVRANRRGEPHN